MSLSKQIMGYGRRTMARAASLFDLPSCFDLAHLFTSRISPSKNSSSDLRDAPLLDELPPPPASCV